MLRRLPIESAEPVVLFAFSRLAVTLLGLAAMLILSVPEDGPALAMIAAIAIPWAGLMVFVSLRDPRRGLTPLVAAGDLTVLLAVELLAPETYGGVRFAALFLTATHAHFQGERRGLAVGAIGAGSLVTATALSGDAPVGGDVLAFYETAFVVCSLAAAVVVGRLRTSESASRLRARTLTRRTLQTESETRRRVAEAIHDGPVQELIGLEMMLSSASRATAEGRNVDAAKLLDDAREVTQRSVDSLRDEIVDLGPYAFEMLGFETAIERCIEVWRRRYGLDIMLTIERIDLPVEVTGDLFRITQEAVVNAGRHADAKVVSISLRRVASGIELRVTDDGHGFDGADPLGASEPGHLGLGCMRERAELMQGKLGIESSERGTKVVVTVPLSERTEARRSRG
jgi:two-component system, NarL family, sensor kinase